MTIGEALRTELGPDQGCLAVINASGDTKVTWNRGNEIEVEAARAAFKSARAKGYMGYKVEGQDGRKGTVITEFDPAMERIIMAPPMQGGA